MYKNRNTGTGNGTRGTGVMLYSRECRQTFWRITLKIQGNVAKHSGECHQTFRGMLPNILGNNANHFFSVWVFFHEHSRITGLQWKGEGIYLTPHYHFLLLHRHLDISRAFTAESSPLHIASSRTRTGNPFRGMSPNMPENVLKHPGEFRQTFPGM